MDFVALQSSEKMCISLFRDDFYFPCRSWDLGLDLDNSSLITGLNVPKTDDWEVYTTVTESAFLPYGKHVLRVNIEKAGFNLSKPVTGEVTSVLGKELESGVGNIIDLSRQLKGVYLIKINEKIQ